MVLTVPAERTDDRWERHGRSVPSSRQTQNYTVRFQTAAQITLDTQIIGCRTLDKARDIMTGWVGEIVTLQAKLHRVGSDFDQEKFRKALIGAPDILKIVFALAQSQHNHERYCVGGVIAFPKVIAFPETLRGTKGGHIEDLSIAQGFNRRGLAGELIARTVRDGLSCPDMVEMSMDTDERNYRFKQFANLIGSSRDDGYNYVFGKAHGQRLQLVKYPKSKAFKVAEIDFSQIAAISQLGLPQELVSHTGDMRFRGLIVYHNGIPVACAPGAPVYSTFSCKLGIGFEDIVFAANLSNDMKAEILNEILDKSYNMCSKLNPKCLDFQYFKIHTADSFLVKLLLESGLQLETMDGTPDSVLFRHALKGENLSAFKNRESRVISCDLPREIA